MHTHDEVDTMLEDLRKRLTTSFGVTLVEDTIGEFGPLGARYLTLRWNDDTGNLVQVSTRIRDISKG